METYIYLQRALCLKKWNALLVFPEEGHTGVAENANMYIDLG